MSITRNTPALMLAPVTAAMALSGHAHADFIADSKASLQMRNFYFNSDYRQPGARQSKREEWAQGFILDVKSGYTEGTVGFGVDAIGLLGVKLDSSPDRTNTGLLPIDNDGRAPDEYSQLGLTAKARLSKSTLHVGTLMPKLPTLRPSDSRLLPQTFRGAHLVSEDISGLRFNLGRMTQNSLRNYASSDDMSVTGKGIRGGQPSDRFDFGGVRYDWGSGLATSYDYAQLERNYRQHIVNITHLLPIAEGQSLASDIRYAHSTDDGNTNVDNGAFGAMFTYNLSAHAFTLAYQKMSGGSGYPYVNGTDAFLVNYSMLSPDFANPNEKSWQARYDYDFSSLGAPGLLFSVRYVKGDGFEWADGSNGREWERNLDLRYTIQSGPLKNLGLRWRNAISRSNGGNDLDQNRLILSYTLPLL